MQNTKLIKKISTSLVSTGEIIDSLQSNSSTSAPSIRAVVDNMTPPMNLLINGDFKVNQRGQTKYTGGSYSLDMWLLTNGELTKNEIGITLNANHSQYNLILYQFIEPDVFKGDKGVIVAKINGIRHIYKINIGKESQNEPYLFYDEDDISVGSLYFYWNNSRNKYDVYISVNRTRSIQVEYIDLFEGSIAYPHNAEDDAIALLRCRSKLKVFKANEWIGLAEVVSSVYATIFVDLSELDGIPTMKWNSITIYQPRELYKEVINVDMDTNRFGNGNMVGLTLKAEPGLNSDMRVGKVFLSLNGYLEFSYEPL